MSDKELLRRCTTTSSHSDDAKSSQAFFQGRASIVVIFDDPFDFPRLDECLFSLVSQTWESIEVVIVTPDRGGDSHKQVEQLATSYPWSDQARWVVVSVPTLSRSYLSGELLFAGIAHSSGQYLAVLHHQDLIYQHAYSYLINQLQTAGGGIALGGVRLAQHEWASPAWRVTKKQRVMPGTSRFEQLVAGSVGLHSLLIDRSRLDPSWLVVSQPSSELAVLIFFLRIAFHPKADWSLAATPPPVSETRHPPHDSNVNRLPSFDAFLNHLAEKTLTLRPDALCLSTILTDALQKAS